MPPTDYGSILVVHSLWKRLPVRWPTREKINDFRNLRAGWNYGEGGPPSEAVINSALSFHDLLLDLGFLTTDAFPGPQGEIVVTGYEGEQCVEVIIEAEGSISVAHERGATTETDNNNMTSAQAKILLREIADRIWSTLDYSTRSTSMLVGGALRVSRSATQVVPAAYLLSRADVFKIDKSANVLIYENIIHPSLESRSFFGNSTTTDYRQDATSSSSSLPVGMIATTTSRTPAIRI